MSSAIMSESIASMDTATPVLGRFAQPTNSSEVKKLTIDTLAYRGGNVPKMKRTLAASCSGRLASALPRCVTEADVAVKVEGTFAIAFKDRR
jgi:hypothetical protein